MKREDAMLKNRPVNPKKGEFYDALIEYYSNTTGTNDKANEIENAIEGFLEKGKRLPFFNIENVKVLNKEIVKKYKPTHTRKIALYNALIAYMDAKFGEVIEDEIEDGFPNDLGIEDGLLDIVPSFIGVAIISPAVKKDYEEKKKETEKKKKHYSINVHLDLVVPVEVDAVDEETALRVAKSIADMQNYDDISVRDACVTNVR